MSTRIHIVIRLSVISVMLLGSSCRLKRQVVIVPPIDTTLSAEKIVVRNARNLSDLMHKNEFQYDYLTARFDAEVSIDGKDNSFNVSVRSKRDSILWMSFSLLGIEGARMLATPDSVSFIDRVNKKYFTGDYFYISQLLNTEVDFDLLQSVLIGNSVAFYDEDDKLKAATDSSFLLLSTIRKRRIKRLLNRAPENVNLKDLVQRIWISPDNSKIAKIIINDFNSSRTFEAYYSDFRLLDASLFPYEVNYKISAQKVILVKINYGKVVREKPSSFNFSIPDGYEKIR